eukprot:7612603-Lingulodinium_polyedra.AAC.1
MDCSMRTRREGLTPVRCLHRHLTRCSGKELRMCTTLKGPGGAEPGGGRQSTLGGPRRQPP